MDLRLLLALLVVLRVQSYPSARSSSRNDQESVLEIWRSILPSLGIFPRLQTKKTQPHLTFFGLVEALQTIFVDDNEPLNVLVIGACDGTEDPFLERFYRPNRVWNGLFVEPIGFNFHDLGISLNESIEEGRTHLLRGAVLEECSQPTVTMRRPIFEETNRSEPHWKRRQIAQVLDVGNGTTRPMSRFWTTERVRCLTSSELLFHWRHLHLRTPNPPASNM